MDRADAVAPLTGVRPRFCVPASNVGTEDFVTMAKVSLKNIFKIYKGDNGNDVAAVQDFTLDVEDREFVVLAGPSGCGKSTMLRLIAGLDEISKGDLLIGGRRVNDVPPKDRDIAMVFQDDALYPHMTVHDNLAFGLKLRKVPKTEIEKRVREAAGMVGIEPYLDRKPKALSDGQRQRVALGRAVVRKPKVFLFDEPLSNLDGKLRIEIAKLHQRLQVTMIYATHDQLEAMTLGDRIVVMKDGLIQQIDAPLKLYDTPANLFVSGFIGSPPMNFITGKLKDAPDGVIFKEMEGGIIECRITGRPGAKAFVGKEVILGVRPEDIELITGGNKPGPGCFQALADFVEPMGGDTDVHLQTGAHTILARGHARLDHGDAGHRIVFGIATPKAHLFDPLTTKRIQ